MRGDRVMEDTYRVLPHRDVLDCTMYSTATGQPIGDYDYEHVPCGMPLTRRDVVEANWCHHCAKTINKAAQRRGQAEYSLSAGRL
jgi:hypothetical protein